ncbi:MAG: DUF4446 family protein [Candidatus Limnocylindrus sp.]
MQTDALSTLTAAAALLGGLAILVALLALLAARTARRKLAALMREGEGSRAGQLARLLEVTAEHGRQLRDGSARIAELELAAQRAVSRIGHVQFQAYDDAGAGQSSSLALLDDVGSGVVITTLHARVGTRIYVKRLVHGESETVLGEEERAAIDAALRPPSDTRRAK